MLCPHCGGKMRIIAFLTDYAVVDRIIDHLILSEDEGGANCHKEARSTGRAKNEILSLAWFPNWTSVISGGQTEVVVQVLPFDAAIGTFIA